MGKEIKPSLKCKHPTANMWPPSCAAGIVQCKVCKAFVDLTLPRNQHLSHSLWSKHNE